MGRAPCCDKTKVKRGPWSPEEDETLKNYVEKFGTGGNWIALPHKAGLKRCGKSCRLRWLNYLRPHIKRGGFTEEEDNIIISLFGKIGSRWSVIASHLPGRTDNDVKNHWNTKLKKKLFGGNKSPSSSSTKLNNNNHHHEALFINAPNSSNNPINCHPSSTPFPPPYNPNFPILDDNQLYNFPSLTNFLTQNTLPTTFPTFYDSYSLIDNDHSTPNNLVFDPIQLPPQGVGHLATTTTICSTSCSPQEASGNISASPSSSLTTMDHQNNYLPFPSMEGGTNMLLEDFGFEFGCNDGHGSGIGCLSCHGTDDQENGWDPSCFGFQRCKI